MVSILLEHGANPNLHGGIYGNTLQAASKEGHREVIALFLNNGARINAQGGIYGTALQAAAREGREETVRLLLENGADVDARAGYWGTALHAASSEHAEIAAILLDCGADRMPDVDAFGLYCKERRKREQKIL
jgi:ankyrin repeat protein